MLQANEVLRDRYQLTQKLGQNAGRQTWLAQDLQSQENVVIKLLAFGDQVQWDDLKLFEREAQVLRQLNHPQIPKYRDYFPIDDRILWFGLVQDYIPGSSLKDLLVQGQRFNEPQIRQIAANVLQILTYLHELNPLVLHRDIKPSNLVWCESGSVYLIDFGAVQDRAATEGSSFTVVGTYGYAPMEQFGGRSVPATDLYALGATLIHLLTGAAPADLPQRNFRIQFADQVNVSSGLIHWLETMTEPDLVNRFSTARQALESLQSAQKISPGHSINSGTSQIRTAPLANVQRPTHTSIQLSKSAHELLITFPKPKLRSFLLIVAGFVAIAFSTLVMIGMCLAGTSIDPRSLLFFFGFVSAITWGVIWETHPLHISFGQKQFVSYKAIGKGTCVVFSAMISSIEDVFHTVKSIPGVSNLGSYKTRVVAVQTTTHEYDVGKKLDRDEAAWLVQEIKSWLEIQ